MKNYDIIYIPDPVLKQTAHQVDAIDDNIRAQMDGMLSAMYDAPGIGLAANQVGLLNRVLVMDLADKDAGGFIHRLSFQFKAKHDYQEN